MQLADRALTAVLSAVVALGLFTAACAPVTAPATAPAQGGALTVGLNAQIATLDPNKWTGSWELSVGQQVYDYLVAIDLKEPRISPWLAESWTVSSDALTYTFKLRRGVKFHDGTGFDAAVAKMNLERLSETATLGSIRELASNLAGVAAPDDVTLEVRLKSPSLAFLNSLAGVPMLSPSAADRWGDDFGQHPVGTGAFKLKEWVAQDHLTLERNADYTWPPANSTNPGPAHLESITFKFIVDPAARLVSLESGDSQMVTFVPLQDVARLGADARFTLAKGAQPGGPLALYLNGSDPVLADRQVRVAIQSALDRAALVQTGGYGQPIAASGLLSSATRCFSGAFGGVFAYDPARSRQLLDSAGWHMGPDGVRQKDGTLLAFEMLHFPDYTNLATVIQAQLREVGAQANLKMLDIPAGGALMRKGQVSAFLVAQNAGDPSVLTNVYHSRSIGATTASGAIVRDSDTDALLDAAARETDAVRQCQLYDQFQQRYLDAALAYPVWEIVAPVAMRSNIHGIRLVASTGSMPLFQEVYLAG